mgnify:CR=1 FL=1
MRPKEFEFLVDAIKSLPSVGSKAAERIAYHLIHQDQQYVLLKDLDFLVQPQLHVTLPVEIMNQLFHPDLILLLIL